MPWWVSPFLAFLCAAGLTGALLASGLARRLALDRPNARSLHAQPTPRAGGIAIIAAVVLFGWPLPHALRVALLAMLGLVAVSLLDDMRHLHPGVRLAAHAAAAMAVVLSLGVGGWGAALMVLAVMWMTNLYNFMDGADGLAGGMAVIGFAFLGLAALDAAGPPVARFPFVVAAAAGGFLAFNFPPARIFLGDAGSIPLGFLAGALGLWGWHAGLWPWFFPPMVFAPFILDASVTLGRRIIAGQRVWEAHRDHYYQRAVRMGLGHKPVALAEYALMTACGVAALAARVSPPALQWAIVLGMLVVIAGMMLAIDARWRRACIRGRL